MPIDMHMLIHRWFEEVWNQGREETVDELFTPGTIAHGLSEGEEDIHGPENFKLFLRTMRSAFPDVNIRVDDVITGDDKAVARISFKGTHLGGSLGIPATRRPVSFGGIVIIRVENGRFVEGWNCWDQHRLLQQIGADTAPPAETRDRFLAAR